jgi:hypothetical protein
MFDDKPMNNLPYTWNLQASGAAGYPIFLPYNNAAAQTVGFTIPQDIIDNGIVLSYIRYFLQGPSDTATSAGMTDWNQMPYASYNSSGLISGADITTSVGADGFTILASNIQSIQTFINHSIPAEIRIVLIPSGMVTTLQQINPDLHQLTMGQLTEALEADKEKQMINLSGRGN